MTHSEKPSDVWTVKDVLAWTSKRFQSMGMETPLLDSQLLIGSVLNLDKVRLYMHYERPLSMDERSRMRELVQRRISGEPVAYLLGKKFWHTLDLVVDRRVLIPRPETETLLDFVLVFWEKNAHAPRLILDLCTGSGCLAVALAKKFSHAKVIAVDCSEDALQVARENATRNGVTNVEFRNGDVFSDSLIKNIVAEFGPVDILVANPPYVTEQEWLACSPGVRDFEPKIALVSQLDGLAHGKAILAAAHEGVMAEHSVFAMELGTGAPERIFEESRLSSAEQFGVYSFHTPVWEIPRESWFALRDLEARARFLCRVSGLRERCLDPVGDGDSCFKESDATLSDEF